MMTLTRGHQIIEGVRCGDHVCLKSHLARDHFLVARPDSRLVWHPFLNGNNLSECAKFSVYCDNPYPSSSRLDRFVLYHHGVAATDPPVPRCQLVLGVSDNPEVVSDVIVRIYDRFLVWCRLQDCWSDLFFMEIGFI